MKTPKRTQGKYSRGKKAVGICDRSGFKCLLKDLVKEPGTGLMVSKDMNDGMWNRVDHPQRHSGNTSESIGLRNPRPDVPEPAPDFALDGDGAIITDEHGLPTYNS